MRFEITCEGNSGTHLWFRPLFVTAEGMRIVQPEEGNALMARIGIPDWTFNVETGLMVQVYHGASEHLDLPIINSMVEAAQQEVRKLCIQYVQYREMIAVMRGVSE